MYKLKSSKLIIFIVFGILSTLLLWFGKVSGSEYFDFIKWVIALFYTANIGSKFFRNGIDLNKKQE